MRSRLLPLCLIVLASGTAPVRGQDLNEAIEQAIQAAVKKVAPATVQIVTQGGTDMISTGPKGPAIRKGQGPTTGVVVSADGYVISSAFNFVNNPTNILVLVPGHSEPYVARRVANDKARMLTLLKIENKTPLPAPAYVPEKDLHEGQWAIAVGRALETKRDQPPSVSVGIISAIGRIWGKALQTDAKISPVNYGGPLVDIQGRVQGILVPASPRGEGETIGFEWYDSGIGFAIPMEEIQTRILPLLKQGKDLQKGLLGVRMKSNDMYGALPEIGEVMPNTAAARAGLQAGDVITEIDGKPVVRMAQILHILGRKYEGDKISLKYRRGKEMLAIADLELVGNLVVAASPFLGILPMRDDPKLGVEVRYVYPKSPADKAGLKPGDRILKYGFGKAMQGFLGVKPGRDQFFDFLYTRQAGDEIKLEVQRKDGKTETLTASLDPLPGSLKGQNDDVPERLPEPATFKKALEPLETANKNIKPAKKDPDGRKPETGLLKKTTPDGEHPYWVYVPEDYDPNISYGIVLWLHPPGRNKDADFEAVSELWADFCTENHLILVMPKSEGASGWIPSEADFVTAAVRDALPRWTIDRRRVVAHGWGVGGQMAIYLAFHHRDLFRGAASIGSVATGVKDNVKNQRLYFWVAGGALDPLIKGIAEGRDRLQEKKLPVTYHEIPNRGREYLEEAQLRNLVRWIDSLDRQ